MEGKHWSFKRMNIQKSHGQVRNMAKSCTERLKINVTDYSAVKVHTLKAVNKVCISLEKAFVGKIEKFLC